MLKKVVNNTFLFNKLLNNNNNIYKDLYTILIYVADGNKYCYAYKTEPTNILQLYLKYIFLSEQLMYIINYYN